MLYMYEVIVTQLARVAKVIKHSNAHFIFAEAFVTADTLFEAVSQLTPFLPHPSKR